MSKDYYHLLGVSKGATYDQIKQAYRHLDITYRFQKNDNVDSRQRFKDITEAYEVLTNPRKRAIYDKYVDDMSKLNTGTSGNNAGFGTGYATGYGTADQTQFGGVYYDPYSANANNYKAQNGDGVYNQPYLYYDPTTCSYRRLGETSFNDLGKSQLYKGYNTKYSSMYASQPLYDNHTNYNNFNSNTRLPGYPNPPATKNTNTTNNTNPQTTNVNANTANVPKQDPPVYHYLYLTFEEIATGTTKKMKVSRKVLNPDGVTTHIEDKMLLVDIKPGWKAGTKITFSREGDQAPNTIPADLVFVIKEKDHPNFKRDGIDLIYTAKITLKEALSGTTIQVPTLDEDRKEELKITDVVNTNTEKRLVGEGLPSAKQPNKKGDIVVRFYIYGEEAWNKDAATTAANATNNEETNNNNNNNMTHNSNNKQQTRLNHTWHGTRPDKFKAYFGTNKTPGQYYDTETSTEYDYYEEYSYLP